MDNPTSVPPGFWRRDAAHNPLPRTPLTRSMFDENPAMVAACEAYGFLVTVKAATIGGWHYGGLAWVGGAPDWLVPLLIRVLPVPRRRVKACRAAIRDDLVGRVIEQWDAAQRPEFERRIERMLATDLSTMDDRELVGRLHEVRALAADGLLVHFMVIFANLLAVGELTGACQRLLGWEQDRVAELLAGLSAKSTEPARALSTLAGRSEGPELDAALEEYHRIYGHRALAMELADPTLAEVPGLALRLLRDQAAGDFDPESDAAVLADRRARAVNAARARLAGAELAEFERALHRALRGYPLREDNVFFTIDTPLGLARYAALEAGRRLAAVGSLGTVDDVFFCELAEVVDALRSGLDLHEPVARRRAERARTLANPGPPTHGRAPHRPLPLHRLPDDVRASTEALLWMADRVLEPELSVRARPSDAGTLTGVAASGGRYRGPVRVIESEAQFGKLRAGDVLVCQGTRSSWSVLFPTIGAVVTDSGGSLSHPAIIAREYRIPAVVATAVATSTLRDGQIVTVDGTSGVVTIEPKVV